MQGLGKIKNKKITCIPNNSEKFISFSLGKLRFLDSLQFLNAPLDKLVSSIDKSDLKLTKEYFGDKAYLMFRKGCYPYEYMDNFEKFNDTSLPSKDDFYSHLTEEDITLKEYDYAQKVWNEFNIKYMGDYHDLYVVSDVLLLADIFFKISGNSA